MTASGSPHSPEERPITWARGRRLHTALTSIAVVVAALGAWIWSLPEPVLADALTLVDPDRSLRSPSQEAMGLCRTLAGAISLAGLLAAASLVGLRERARRWFAALFAPDAAADRVTAQPLPPLMIALVIAVAIGGIGLRLQLALTRPIGPDEAINYVFFVSRSFADIASDYQIPNNHVLHTILARVSMLVFGSDPWALRLPALVAGVLTIPATYALGKKLFDPWTGALAACCVAVANPLVEFSADARGYTLLVLAVVSAFVVASDLHRRRSLPALGTLVLLGALGAYTLPVMAYGMITLGFWLLLSAPPARRKALLVELAVAGAATGLLSLALYAPILLRTGAASLFSHSQSRPIGIVRGLAAIPERAIETWSAWSAPAGLVGAAACAIAVAAIVAARTRHGQVARRLTIALLATVLPIFVLQRIAPPPRAFVFLFPFVVCIVCSGAVHLARRLPARPIRRRVLLPAGLAVAFGAWMLSSTGRTATHCIEEPARGVAEIVATFRSRLGDQDVLVAHAYSGFSSPGRYHLLRAGDSPRLLHTYVIGRDHDQLMPYRRMYVVIRKDTGREPGLARLGFTADVIRDQFLPPRHAASFSTADVYLFERKGGAPLGPTPYPDDPWGFAALW